MSLELVLAELVEDLYSLIKNRNNNNRGREEKKKERERGKKRKQIPSLSRRTCQGILRVCDKLKVNDCPGGWFKSASPMKPPSQ